VFAFFSIVNCSEVRQEDHSETEPQKVSVFILGKQQSNIATRYDKLGCSLQQAF